MQRQPNNRIHEPRKPSFSCVVTGVDLDITADEVKQQLDGGGFQYTNVWRVKSRQSNKETGLVRVVTDHNAFLDRLISRGINIFLSHHRVETSRASPAQPNQCRTCQEFHAAGKWAKSDVCGLCAKSHTTRTCTAPAEKTKCAKYFGAHLTFPMKCHQRPVEVKLSEEAVPLHVVDSDS